MQLQAVLVLLASFLAVTQAQQTVSCKNAKGEAAQFNAADCHKVATKLAQGHVSTAKCNSCALALVNPSTKQAFQFAQAVDANLVIKAVDKVLSSCGSSAQHSKRADPAAHRSNAPVVVLGRGDGTC